VKLKDKLLVKYFATFQNLDESAKAQLLTGFQILGLALGLIGIFLTSYSVVVGGFVFGFGVGMIVTARVLFK